MVYGLGFRQALVYEGSFIPASVDSVVFTLIGFSISYFRIQDIKLGNPGKGAAMETISQTQGLRSP